MVFSSTQACLFASSPQPGKEVFLKDLEWKKLQLQISWGGIEIFGHVTELEILWRSLTGLLVKCLSIDENPDHWCLCPASGTLWLS